MIILIHAKRVRQGGAGTRPTAGLLVHQEESIGVGQEVPLPGTRG